jgi:hypothetical protein
MIFSVFAKVQNGRCTYMQLMEDTFATAASFIAFCWGLSGAGARAQQFSSAETKPSPTPTPIPLSEIASHAESTTRFLQNIETTLSKDRVTATVEKSLPFLTSEIELREAEMAKYLAGVVPLELLHSMAIVLQRYGDQLSSWNNDLTARAKVLDRQIAQLDGLSKIWKSTLQVPQLSKTAPEIPDASRVSLILLVAQSKRQNLFENGI